MTFTETEKALIAKIQSLDTKVQLLEGHVQRLYQICRELKLQQEKHHESQHQSCDDLQS